MKKIGFIGAFEKTDLIIYTAKILTQAKQKVLVIDTTILQKARYIVPSIAPTKFYITEYEGIDVAVGFDDLESINRYVGELKEYDIILIDVDSYEAFDSFKLIDSSKNYFVTAFDSFSLKKGMEIIGTMRQNIRMEKILFEREIIEEDNEYLNLLSVSYPIQWEEEIIYFPYEQGDLTAIIENQRVTKIKFKNLSDEYRDGLAQVAQEILPQLKKNDLKKILKNI